MAEIKFNCPECKQRIGVESSAAGVAIECPACRSSLVIPAVSGEVPTVLRRQRIAALASAGGGGGGDGDAELERKQKELQEALNESARWRAESTAPITIAVSRYPADQRRL